MASMVFVIVFVILVGASAAVVRAGIMGCISLMGIWFGRQYYVTQALMVAAFLMNLWNPKILVYDVLGNMVTTLIDKKQRPGNYSVNFDASNYPSGTYFYQLQTGSYINTKKMLLIK